MNLTVLFNQVATRWVFGLLTSISCLLIVLASNQQAMSQAVGLNNASPDASSILDAAATDRGILIPRMTTAQRNAISSPANGLMVYDTDMDLLYFNSGTSGAPNWVPMNTGFHASKTRIKIIPSDFMTSVETGGKGAGGPVASGYGDNGTTNYGVVAEQDDIPLICFVVIPTGYKATHVRIYGSDTGRNYTVYESDISTGALSASLGTTTVGSQVNITDVNSTSTNFLVIIVDFDNKETDIAYGGYVTIAPI